MLLNPSCLEVAVAKDLMSGGKIPEEGEIAVIFLTLTTWTDEECAQAARDVIYIMDNVKADEEEGAQ